MIQKDFCWKRDESEEAFIVNQIHGWVLETNQQLVFLFQVTQFFFGIFAGYIVGYILVEKYTFLGFTGTLGLSAALAASSSAASLGAMDDDIPF